MYGQTEASPRVTILPFKYLFSHYNSVGLPIGKNKIFIKKKFKQISKTRRRRNFM